MIVKSGGAFLMKSLALVWLFLLLPFYNSLAQKSFVYKHIDSTALSMEMYTAELGEVNKAAPAMIFFFGGGWVSGSIEQFRPHAIYFSKRGITCFLAEYRIRNKHHTSPLEAVADAKSAIRYLRENAEILHIDPDRIIAAGGSAGGHLAAATDLIADFGETKKEGTSCRPNALVLFNPVIDNGPGGYGYERIGEYYKDFSPLHNVRQGAAPCIIFLGTNDKLIPVEMAKYYQKVMQKVGSTCELTLYEGQEHGFFNYRNFEFYQKTLLASDAFLQSLGYLSQYPVVKIE